MLKKMVRKILGINLILIMIVVNFTCLFNQEVIATAAEGKFVASELPYNIKFTKISSNNGTTLALDSNGDLWAWGSNNNGTYGNGTTTTSRTPIKVSTSVKFVEISANYLASAAIDTSGNIWTWGSNNYYQLGNGTQTKSSTPTKITNGTKFVKVIAAGRNMIALDSTGNIWGWGDNMDGVLLNEGKGNEEDNYGYYQSVPLKITSGRVYKDIECNEDTVAAIDSNNNLWMWGDNSTSLLSAKKDVYVFNVGFGKRYGSYTPIQIKSGTQFSQIALGAGFAMAIDTSNDIWGWGIANEDQLDLNVGGSAITSNAAYDRTNYSITYPIRLTGNMKSVNIGTNTVVIEYMNGTVYKTGKNVSYAQVVQKNYDTLNNYMNYKEIYVYNDTIMIFDSNGDLWMMGENSDGQIGNGTTTDATSLIQITGTTQTYIVTFKNGTSTVSTQTIEKGKAATAPSLTKAGYTLSWDKSFSNVTSNLTVNAVWTAKTNTAYKIEHYKQNTSLNGYTLAETENKTGTTDSLAVATKKTYTGFTENTSYSGRVASGTVAGNGSLVLKLYYDRNSYTVTLNANGGTINAGNVTSYKYGIAKTLPTNVTKTGYTFGGWYANSGLTGSAVTSVTATETGNKTYYAKWNINTYTVTFKNGSETAKTQTVNYGTAATAPTLTKAGYTLSWDKAFNNVTSNLTVNAVWTANTNTAYKVEHYKQNTSLNGYNLADTENKTGTTDTTVTASKKTYTGFTENTSYSGRVASGTVAGNGSLVLKLYYDRNSYTVTLNANSGTINAGNVTSYRYGIAQTLPTNVTKTGYTFGGWYVNSDLSGNAVTSITATETGNKTYYAKWNINKYTVTFKNGSETAKTQTVEYGKAATAPSLTKAGYTLSWDKAFNNVTSNLTVNAVWTANTNTAYKVEYYKQNINLNGYELAETENKTAKTNEQVTATSKVYQGFTENTQHEQRVTTGLVEGNGGLVLKLYYDRNSYNIELNTNGGTINSDKPIEYIYGKETQLPIDVTKEGYIFDGWYDNEGLEGVPVTKIEPDDFGDKEYYIKWTKNEFTVIFKNGIEIVKTQIVIKGQGATAPELTKVGYTLSWDKAFTNVTSDLTVNAVWTANTNTAYKVEHYLRNLDMEVEGYDLLETENLTGTTDTETTAISKTYKGFTYDSENPNKIVSGNIEGDGSLVLKLYYSRNSYSITYELNAGTASNQLTNSYIYGKGLVLSNRVTKQGHVFAGWYANSELTGESVTTIGKEETGDKTYYAKWIEEEEFYITSEKYSINMEEKQITKVSPKTKITEFTTNINTNGIVKVLNLNGQEVTGDTLVGTGYKLQIDFKGTKHEYEIAVRGDLDGNGKISVTDLSILNQIMVKKLTLTGVRAKASDLDFSNKTTITDLSMMNQAIVGKITL